MKTIIKTEAAPAAVGAYSQGISTGDLYFFSGQIPLCADGSSKCEADIITQTEQVLFNIGELLKSVGLSYKNIVKTTIFLTDINNFAAVNEVYSKYFSENPPARSCVAVSALPKGAAVEIECIAAK